MSDLKLEYTKAKRKLFDKVYRKMLNPEQARAVFTAKGPLLVLAGAGSGKTTVLVSCKQRLFRSAKYALGTNCCPQAQSPPHHDQEKQLRQGFR